MIEPMPKGKTPDPYWFILRTAHGAAGNVASALLDRAATLGLAGSVLEIRAEDRVDAGVPGCVLVKMPWNPVVWAKIRAFPGVIGILGERNLPLPVTDRELPAVLRKLARGPGGPSLVRIHGDPPED